MGLFGAIKGHGVVVFDLGLEKISIPYGPTGSDGGGNIGGLAGALFNNSHEISTSVSNCYSNGDIEGSSSVGGLIGYSVSKIDNCYSSAYVNAYDSNGGGLLGKTSSSLSNSYATGIINGEMDIGGLIGTSASGVEITNCYTDTQVVGANDRIVGLIGFVDNSVVTNCYAHGDVSGSNIIGGLIGENSGVIKNCYAIGEVRPENYDYSNSTLGGLVGNNWSEIYDSFTLEFPMYDVIGNQEESLMGRTVETSSTDIQSNHIYTEHTLTGYDNMYEIWDDTIWNFGTDNNPAYPTLSWE